MIVMSVEEILQEVTDFPTGSPREVLRKAFEVGLIQDDIWMEMLKVRNEFSHECLTKAICAFCSN